MRCWISMKERNLLSLYFNKFLYFHFLLRFNMTILPLHKTNPNEITLNCVEQVSKKSDDV